MPTAAELKVLLRPLLKRHPELGFARRVLFFTPLTHYLRGVGFSWKNSGASDLIPFACPLYTGDFYVSVDGANREDTFRIQPEWKEQPERTSRELCDMLEQRFLPSVEPLVDFERHLKEPNYIRKRGLSLDGPAMLFWRALSACTVADYDSAQKLLEQSEDKCKYFFSGSVSEELRFSEDFFQKSLYFLRVLRTDRTRVLPLLHDWEAFMVKANGIAKYWKPSPFPCEPLT